MINSNSIKDVTMINNGIIKNTYYAASGPPTENSAITKIYFNVNQYPVKSFTGRVEFLQRLHRLMYEERKEKLTTVKVVSGLGGIGKTETARKYILDYSHHYHSVIWLNAESSNTLENSFIKLAQDENVKVATKEKNRKPVAIETIIKNVYEKICSSNTSKPSLIIFDNAEDFRDKVERFLPPFLPPELEMPVILVTSRNQEWEASNVEMQVLPLDVLSQEETLDLILGQLEVPGDVTQEEFRAEALELADIVGGLPLALQQAIAYIRQQMKLKRNLGRFYKIKDYVHKYKKSMEKFQNFPHSPGTTSTVYVTWNVTFEKIQNLGSPSGQAALEIIQLLAFLNPDNVPSTFLCDLMPQLDPNLVAEALNILEKYSFISIRVGKHRNLETISPKSSISIHRQVQFVTIEHLRQYPGDNEENIEGKLKNIIQKSRAMFSNKGFTAVENSDSLTNIQKIVDNTFELSADLPKSKLFQELMLCLAEYLYTVGRYPEFFRLVKRIDGEHQSIVKENNLEALINEGDIARLLSKYPGKFEEALGFYFKVLERKGRDLGDQHQATLTTNHNLVVLFRQSKKFDQAAVLFQQVLQARTEALGEGHPDTIQTKNQYALLRCEQGMYGEAVDLYREIESSQEKLLGADHLDTLMSKSNTGLALLQLGRAEEALEILQHVYDKYTNPLILGENHPETFKIAAVISNVFQKQGRLEESLDLRKKVYEGRKALLGIEHPDTLQVYEGLKQLRVAMRN